MCREFRARLAAEAINADLSYLEADDDAELVQGRFSAS
jgi:hypothetical protein